MSRPTLLAVAGWLVAATVATLTGLAAVRVIGDGITGTAAATLSEREVREQLASAPPPVTVSPHASASQGGGTVLASAAGTIVATCADGLVTLLSWAPAQGYRVAEAAPGPDDEAEVEFARGSEWVEVKIVCAAGEPTISREKDD
ncbi:septum formation initiator [Micromonospora sp. CPCC 205371]|nr:septum formation initiator [Micromonospora sp. CPCC 205371]